MKNQFCTLEDSTGEWRVILIPAVCKDKQKRVFAAAASLAPLSGKMDESIISILSTSALVFICAMGFLHIANKMHFRFAEELISDKNETESRNENYSGTLFDAMERRISHLEFELNDAKTEAAAKSLFLSNAAHELKTPLSPIVGFADMLAKERLDSVHLRMVKQIRQNAFRELELVEDILEYARLDSGRIKLEAKEVNIKNELESCISQMKTYHPGAKIFLDVDKDLDKFKIDPNRFRQIILKLLSNAIKFMPVDGETHVSAAIQEDPEREKNLIVSVHDNGIGIAESDFDKIFQPFGKIDSTKAKSFEGIGLGLVTAKRLAELHGGRIDLESQPGKGSKFIVNLPSKEA
jgi:signal transduction histidine kinase